jgi:Tol biopolymer transport system component
MSPLRPTDPQLADALRRELPVQALPGLRDRILAEASQTPQVPAGSRPRMLATGELQWRPILIAAALLLALAIGTAIVGSVVNDLRRDRGGLSLDPLPANGLVAVSANPWTFGAGQNGDIYLVGDGAAPRRIIGSDGDGIAQACPRFAPDGRRLAFGESLASGPPLRMRGDVPVDRRAIVVVGVTEDGSVTEPVLRVELPSGAGLMICPEWSPSGRAIAFRVGGQLWIADAETGATRTLPITNVTSRATNELEWSRDGSRIAVAEPGHVRVLAVDTGESTVIPAGKDVPRWLGWSADDAGLVYVSMVANDALGDGVHLVAADGTNDTLLSRVSSVPDVTFMFGEAVLSPDGTRVAFLELSEHILPDGFEPGPEMAPIVVADLAGTDTEEMWLPRDGSLPTYADGTGYFVSGLGWSPDGRRLLLSSILGIVSIGLEAGSPIEVHATGTPAKGLNLEWSFSELTWQPVRD